jgi:hypothetical protein
MEPHQSYCKPAASEFYASIVFIKIKITFPYLYQEVPALLFVQTIISNDNISHVGAGLSQSKSERLGSKEFDFPGLFTVE